MTTEEKMAVAHRAYRFLTHFSDRKTVVTERRALFTVQYYSPHQLKPYEINHACIRIVQLVRDKALEICRADNDRWRRRVPWLVYCQKLPRNHG